MAKGRKLPAVVVIVIMIVIDALDHVVPLFSKQIVLASLLMTLLRPHLLPLK